MPVAAESSTGTWTTVWTDGWTELILLAFTKDDILDFSLVEELSPLDLVQ